MKFFIAYCSWVVKLSVCIFISGCWQTNFLPSNLVVYSDGQSQVGTSGPQGAERVLPTSNYYAGEDGCYIACYTRNPYAEVYPVGGGIYVTAQLRVQGHYIGRICHPTGYEHQDISAMDYFKRLCYQQFPRKCQGYSCWAGGDTGGWLGR